MLENRWIPEKVKAGLFPKQVEFLCYEGREALYGGSAGGGKSAALLIAALQYVDEPGYSALLLRRHYTQLTKSDSILAKALEWLLPLRVRYHASEHKFTFPSGATLEFGHIANEAAVYNFQGGAWAFVGADETTQFSGPMLAYPRTRQRRVTGSRIPIRWRGGTNPGGIGHDYVKERYVKAKDGSDPATPDRQFFPAKLSDNPHIDQDDYVRQLKDAGVDGVLLDQLLKGDWDAVAGGRFKPEWFGRVYRDPSSPDFLRLVRDGQEVERFKWTDRPRFQTCDPAASTSARADYFVLSTWCVTPKANLVWLACERGKWEIQEQVGLCQASYLRWRPQFVVVEELLNQRSLCQILRRSTTPAMVVHGKTPGGRKKLEHALAAIVLASTGRVYLPGDNPQFPLDDVVAETTRFTGDEDLDANDDIVDTFSYAAECMPMLGGGTGGGRPGVWAPSGVRR
ncbi:Large terminase subunit OS=Methanobacterium phage psiM2 PE=4 SV=1: Terminase_6 [Gemmataceae bacterium]|nr:Large terminase subunit OS=Methanobacterium phage psiM2 PE=4 SV=1: Terminase_6 [Gemmataceae bacterium]VTT96553.1 Large terminase subunit OS=Methanobacterium phage psiM2 PE=4 SV=1: Terminase_6 [Gemmataceae bacterium]